MSRRKSKSNSHFKKTRDAIRSVIATPSSGVRFRFRPPRSTVLKDDRRLFNPSPVRFRLQSGPVSSVTPLDNANRRNRRIGSFSKERVAFASPRKVMVCVRRKERREVLFAKKRTGAGNKRPRWTETSYTACRRS